LEILQAELQKLGDFDFKVFDVNFLEDIPEPEKEIVQDEPPEPPADPITKPGDLWLLGRHRVFCGDSTDPESVAYLMDGQKAALVHADPPYGMGKEKDGVENDNLYNEKLDDFQIKWWRAVRPHIENNGSVYIWGNAEDLWRLWYVGGLKDSERLTFRNEIVWNKKYGHGMESSQHRMYPTATERCLFFMLGEQGFNNNEDNYWEGWEPIRAYLKLELKKVGDIKWAKRAAGHSEKSGCHWFDYSEWRMPTEVVYKSWQKAANGKAFNRSYDELKREYDELKTSFRTSPEKRGYDELKREFYSTRAYFDNTHDSMIDVWDFQRVTGEERNGHATPKPVSMICRAIRSSTPDEAIVIEPFLGSGTTLIAAEQLKRICYGMEISPQYCDVIVKRWENLTGEKAVLHDGK
jgi:DNA modification methylase